MKRGKKVLTYEAVTLLREAFRYIPADTQLRGRVKKLIARFEAQGGTKG